MVRAYRMLHPREQLHNGLPEFVSVVSASPGTARPVDVVALWQLPA